MSTPKVAAPVVGFNHNLKYGGRVFHVQTEDSGFPRAHFLTHLYIGGNILASMKGSYLDRADEPELPQIVRKMMEEQHKNMVRRLVAGEFNEAAARFTPHYEPGVLASGHTGPAAVNVEGSTPSSAAEVARSPAPQTVQDIQSAITPVGSAPVGTPALAQPGTPIAQPSAPLIPAPPAVPLPAATPASAQVATTPGAPPTFSPPRPPESATPAPSPFFAPPTASPSMPSLAPLNPPVAPAAKPPPAKPAPAAPPRPPPPSTQPSMPRVPGKPQTAPGAFAASPGVTRPPSTPGSGQIVGTPNIGMPNIGTPTIDQRDIPTQPSMSPVMPANRRPPPTVAKSPPRLPPRIEREPEPEIAGDDLELIELPELSLDPTPTPPPVRMPGAPLPSTTRLSPVAPRPTQPPRMAPIAPPVMVPKPAPGAPHSRPLPAVPSASALNKQVPSPPAPAKTPASDIPMSIFATEDRPSQLPSDDVPMLFAEELISERSLDEVILAFLSSGDAEKPPK